MALFKIFKGVKDDLGKSGSSTVAAHEGYCYFTTDDGKFYIDIADSAQALISGTNRNRIPISAEKADQDDLGNIIKTAYAASLSLSNHTLTLLAKDGTTLSTITLPDERVAQNNTTTNENYRVLLSYGANNNNETNTVNKSGNLQYNPSTNILSTGNANLTGNLDVVGNSALHGATTIDNLTAGSLMVTGGASFTQTPTAPTAAAGTSNTQLATTEFVANVAGKATQNSTTTSAWRKVLLNGGSADTYSAWDSDVTPRTDVVYQSKSIAVQPSTGTLAASIFKGALNTGTDSSNCFNSNGISFVPDSGTGSRIGGNAQGMIGVYANKIYLRAGSSSASNTNQGLLVEATHLDPYATNVYDLGTSSLKFKTVYATTFDGTATKATADANGNTITTTYAPLASPALTGVPTAPTAAAGTSTTQLATTAFVSNAVSAGFAANDALVFKGLIGPSQTITNLPASGYSAGWTYRVALTNSETPQVYAGEYCEHGDLLIAINNGPSSGNSVIDADWAKVEHNIDGAVYMGHSGTAVGSTTQPVYVAANGQVTAITGSIANSTTGNAATATTLQNSRTIWGQSFNGSTNISGNMTNVGDITHTNETHEYFLINRKKEDGGGWAYSPFYIKGNDGNAFVNFTVYGNNDTLEYISIGANAYSATTNLRIYPDGKVSATKFVGNLDKSLTLKINTGTTEGTSLYTFNNSANKTLDIKSDNSIGLTAAAGSVTISSKLEMVVDNENLIIRYAS